MPRHLRAAQWALMAAGNALRAGRTTTRLWLTRAVRIFEVSFEATARAHAELRRIATEVAHLAGVAAFPGMPIRTAVPNPTGGGCIETSDGSARRATAIIEAMDAVLSAAIGGHAVKSGKHTVQRDEYTVQSDEHTV